MKSTNTESKKVAEILLDIGAVLFSRNRPFKFDSGILSPVYVDNRILISHQKERKVIIGELINLIKQYFPKVDIIAGTATAGIPHAAWVADRLDLPMVYVRSAPKDHGRGNQVEGQIKRGQKAVIIEDLVSTGSSSIKVAQALKKLGTIVIGVVAIYSHNLASSKHNFQKAKLPIVNITGTLEVARVAQEKGYLREEQIAIIKQWIADPKNWGKKMGFE